ncbi:MAG: NAD(P)H-dependent oxidoreductase [Bacteroidales bacterium]
MQRIAIISSSVREERLSNRVALYIEKYLNENYVNPGILKNITMLDLKAYNFPIFEERFPYLKAPSEALLDFTGKLVSAEGLIIVSPVYNSSFPAALKNVIDLYYKEWQHKVIGICSVSVGNVPGIATVQELQKLMLKLGSWVAPVLSTVTSVEKEFDAEGNPSHTEVAEKTVKTLIEEMLLLAR